jgi:hypothetical protein
LQQKGFQLLPVSVMVRLQQHQQLHTLLPVICLKYTGISCMSIVCWYWPPCSSITDIYYYITMMTMIMIMYIVVCICYKYILWSYSRKAFL